MELTNEIKRLKGKLDLLNGTDKPIRQLLIDFAIFYQLEYSKYNFDELIKIYKSNLIEQITNLIPEDPEQCKLFIDE
jgi:hypothetical protein